jgi:nucleoid-associated protein YgaU
MGQGLAKAVIVARDLNEEVRCSFNPSEYTVAKSATWNRTPVRGAESASTPEFVGTNPRSLQLELFFDEFESEGDVSVDVDRILGWTNPTRDSISANRPSPPIVYFQWGTKSLFNAYIRTVSARYTHFRSDGTPLRAHVSLAFEEIPSDPPRQNPTSGGEPGKRTHNVAASDSLPWIAYKHFRDPTLWRGIASFNRIVDPGRLRVGSTIVIPPERTARGLS